MIFAVQIFQTTDCIDGYYERVLVTLVTIVPSIIQYVEMWKCTESNQFKYLARYCYEIDNLNRINGPISYYYL